MSKTYLLPVFRLGYSLVLEIYSATHQFPREHKYTLGNKIKDLSSNLLDFIVMANKSNTKVEYIEDSLVTIERIRIQIRLSYDLKILGKNRYEVISRLLVELEKQLNGWLKWAVKGNN